MYATIRVIGGLIARTWDSSVNPATLTGALDIVAVQHDDGHIECTPFHIRFGRNDAYHANGEAVTMSVNGKRVHVIIKLGPAGEARFVRNVYKEHEDGEGSVLGDTSSLPSAARQHSGDDASSVTSADGGSVMTAPDLLPDGGGHLHARSVTLGNSAEASMRAELFPGDASRGQAQLSQGGDNTAAVSAIDREFAAAAADSASSAADDAAGGDSHSADSDAAGGEEGSPEWKWGWGAMPRAREAGQAGGSPMDNLTPREWPAERADAAVAAASGTRHAPLSSHVDRASLTRAVQRLSVIDEEAKLRRRRHRRRRHRQGAGHDSGHNSDDHRAGKGATGEEGAATAAAFAAAGAATSGLGIRRPAANAAAACDDDDDDDVAAGVDADSLELLTPRHLLLLRQQARHRRLAGIIAQGSGAVSDDDVVPRSLAVELQEADQGSIDALFAFLAGLGTAATDHTIPAQAAAAKAAPGDDHAPAGLSPSAAASSHAKSGTRRLVARGGLLRGAVAVSGSGSAGATDPVVPAVSGHTGSTSSAQLLPGSLASASHASFSALSDATTTSSAAAERAAAAGAALRVQCTGLYADASAAGSRGALLGLDILASSPSGAFHDGAATGRQRGAALPRAPVALPPPSLDDPNGISVLQLAAVLGPASGGANVRVYPVRLLAAFKSSAALQTAWPALAPSALLCQPAPGFTVVVDRIWATTCGSDWRSAPRHILRAGDGRTPDIAAIATELANPDLRFFIAMRIDRTGATDAPGNSVACGLLTGWASASPYIMQASVAAATPRTTLTDGALVDPAASLLSPTLGGASTWTFNTAGHPGSAEQDNSAFALPAAALPAGTASSSPPATAAAEAAAAPSSSSFLGSLFGAIRGSSASAEPAAKPQTASGAAPGRESAEPPSPQGLARDGSAASPALSADGALPLFSGGSVSLPQSPERRALPPHGSPARGPASVDRTSDTGFDDSLERATSVGRMSEGRPRGSSFDGGARVASAAAAAKVVAGAAAAASAESDLPRRHIEEHMLRPSSEELELMGLREGLNVLRFRVNSTGAFVECKLFLWRPSDKIVISDVDGTITKSDAMGHLMYWVGADWTQEGVASFYANIERNGYKLVYLTSRAIGQAGSTRAYLDGIAQSDAHAAAAAGAASKLPPGPVITSPDRLFDAFTREVIMRKPEEFKKQALSDIRRLFPSTANPFFCGFGNRDTDRISYEAVGVPDNRIYIINPEGDILRMGKVEFHTYSKLNEIVDTMFPPFQSKPSTAGGGRTMASPLFVPSLSPGLLPAASPSRSGVLPLTAVPGAAKSVASNGSGAAAEQPATHSTSVPSLRRFGEPEFTEPQFSEASYWRSDSRRRVIVDVMPTNGKKQPAKRGGKPSSGKPSAGSGPPPAAAGAAAGGAQKRP